MANLGFFVQISAVRVNGELVDLCRLEAPRRNPVLEQQVQLAIRTILRFGQTQDEVDGGEKGDDAPENSALRSPVLFKLLEILYDQYGRSRDV